MEPADINARYATAEMLLEIFPGLGRLIAVHMRETGEEDATLMQLGVLMRIKDRSVTTSELAKMRRVSLQSASVLVQNLVERGLLLRTPDPNDRRKFLLEVTPEGRERSQAVREQMVDLIAETLGGLTSEELEAAALFLAGLRRVVSEQMVSESVPES